MSQTIELIARRKIEMIRAELPNRTYRAANELRNASIDVLFKQAGHGGRWYRVPGTRRRYKASAPGEVPAQRTGTFSRSWRPKAVSIGDLHMAIVESTVKTDNGSYVLGDILENGTPGGKMAARPHQDKILKRAKPKVLRIYEENYF